MFALVDTDASGVIDAAEVAAAARGLGLAPSSADARSLASLWAGTAGGGMGLEQFEALVAAARGGGGGGAARWERAHALLTEGDPSGRVSFGALRAAADRLAQEGLGPAVPDGVLLDAVDMLAAGGADGAGAQAFVSLVRQTAGVEEALGSLLAGKSQGKSQG